jgi:hypothetical protein
MTIQELAARLESLGFLCQIDRFDDDGETRLMIHKYRATPGNHLVGNVLGYHPNGYDRQGRAREPHVELDGVGATIWFREDTIEWSAGLVILGGRSPGAYEKEFREPAEVYEEVLHYFFDEDSRMSLEEGFVAGPGRPPGA